MSVLAQFNSPIGVAVGPDGAVYVADYDNHRIRRIQGNQVSTLAGSGTEGFADGASAQAEFNYPYGVAVGPDGAVYVADRRNHRIRKIEGNEVSTLAGSGAAGFADGASDQAQLDHPYNVAVGPDGAVYVADQFHHRIRRIQGNQVSTLAGSGAAGFVDGASDQAQFNSPIGITVGPDGAVYVADYNNHCIRKIQGNQVSTLAGSGTRGCVDGASAQAQFNHPCGVAVGPNGAVYVSDQFNQRIRKIQGNQVSTLAGSGTEGIPAYYPYGIAAGPDGAVYVADIQYHCIRKIQGNQVSTLAGSGTLGFADGDTPTPLYASAANTTPPADPLQTDSDPSCSSTFA